MKKFIFAALATALATNAFANDAAKISTVKKMYQQVRSSAGITIVERYADASLKRAIRNAGDEMCIDADPMWGNQDPQDNAAVNVTMSGSRVKANFKQYGKSVNVFYTLSCQGSSCKISDVNTPGYGSMKSAFNNCN